MFESNPLAAEIAHPVVPLTLVVAQQDQTVPAQDLVRPPVDPTVQLHLQPGGHLLPLTGPAEVQWLILACLDALAA